MQRLHDTYLYVVRVMQQAEELLDWIFFKSPSHFCRLYRLENLLTIVTDRVLTSLRSDVLDTDITR